MRGKRDHGQKIYLGGDSGGFGMLLADKLHFHCSNKLQNLQLLSRD